MLSDSITVGAKTATEAKAEICREYPIWLEKRVQNITAAPAKQHNDHTNKDRNVKSVYSIWLEKRMKNPTAAVTRQHCQSIWTLDLRTQRRKEIDSDWRIQPQATRGWVIKRMISSNTNCAWGVPLLCLSESLSTQHDGKRNSLSLIGSKHTQLLVENKLMNKNNNIAISDPPSIQLDMLCAQCAVRLCWCANKSNTH